jgi:hypothetical protein
LWEGHDVGRVTGEGVAPHGLHGGAGGDIDDVWGGGGGVGSAVTDDVVACYVCDGAVVAGVADGVAYGVGCSSYDEVGEDCVGGCDCSHGTEREELLELHIGRYEKGGFG